MFSTASDNQTAVTIRVFQGEREMASANKLLGQFDLQDIPPAPRGMPQIEVSFDIDANGILRVSAKDLATNKEQKIEIKASSGLSEQEINKMVKDAEAHAEEDRKFHDLVTVRNQADALIHASEKAVKDSGDKVTAEEKQRIIDAIGHLKEALKGNDKALIEAKTNELQEASHKLAEHMYKAAAEANQQNAASSAGQQQNAGNTADKNNSNTVDAEFEEIKDDKK